MKIQSPRATVTKVLTGIQVLDVMARTGRTLADLASVMTRLPQVLRNVRVAHREELQGAASFWAFPSRPR